MYKELQLRSCNSPRSAAACDNNVMLIFNSQCLHLKRRLRYLKKTQRVEKVLFTLEVYGIKQIKVYMEIPFSINPYYMETSQLNWKANQLTGFYIIRGFTETCFYWKVWLVLQGSQIICALSEYQQPGCLLSCRFSH